MRRTFTFYLRLLSIQLRSQMQFRVSFWADIFTTGVLNFSYAASTYLALQRFGNLAGWSVAELAFLYGMVEMAFGTMDMIFSGFDPDQFAKFVQKGELDQILLRPVNVLAQVFGSSFQLRRLGRIGQGALVFAYALAHLGVAWSLPKLAFLLVVFAAQVAAFGALFMAGSTLTFWTVRPVEAVNVVTYGGVEMMSYPAPIYTGWLRGFFTYLLPFVFLNYYPALYFLGRPDPLGFPVFAPFLAPFVAAAMLWLALRFWRFGLSRYQSTGT